MVEDRFTNILHRYWGYPDFRGIQRDIIESVAAGRDTLGLMPTGGGKSLTFQVPAMGTDGVCVVVTPLIALMKDQVLNLRKRGIKADAIYSGRSRSEIIQVLENSIFGGVKILYVSPERLSSELFQIKFRHMKVSFITVNKNMKPTASANGGMISARHTWKLQPSATSSPMFLCSLSLPRLLHAWWMTFRNGWLSRRRMSSG